ncbi:MAG: hypothetical protein CO025_14135 [Ignavibacteria bacterium CG_4_9_14_0_2_um_filter_37_13]|nr:MAG: hypothetical protein CO025_14135 [Ignavibacteria bacterium CG_4_9_14_0_2_um_filter_37_13]
MPSDCVLFYSYGDKRKHEFFIDQLDDQTAQRKARVKLKEMIDYCELTSCRRQHLLAYFGDSISACDNCDCCLRKDEDFDATRISQKILSAVIRCQEAFGSSYIIKLLLGNRHKAIRDNGHEALSVFGIVKEFSSDQLKDII